MVGFFRNDQDGRIVGLLRKQIHDLNILLREFESGKPVRNDARENLVRIEQ